MSNLVRATVAGIVDGTVAKIVGVSDAPYAAIQRVTNGGFASGASWTIASAGWTIAVGRATSAGTGRLYQALVSGSVLPSGGSIVITASIDNANYIILYVETYKGATLAQVLYQDNPATDSFSGTYTATAEWDTISFRCTGGVGLVIDDLTVTA